MEFQVPQFIETEDKIIGPLTLRQFLYLAVAFGISFIMFAINLNRFIWVMLTFIIFVIAATFAFLKFNGQPFGKVFISAINFYWKPKLFLWKKQEVVEEIKFKLPTIEKKRPSLQNLWQQMTTTKSAIPKREKVLKQPILETIKTEKERFQVLRKITGDKELARRVDYR